jgi:hypothetical protein
LTSSALGQKEPDWAQIRGLAQLTATDKKDVNTWVSAQMQQTLSETAAPAARSAGKAFFTKVAGSYKAANASNAFKDTVSKSVIDAFLAQYKPPEKVDESSPHPHGRIYILMTLVTFKTVDALECYQKALTDPSSGVRERGASGLLLIRPNLSAAQWQATLTLVKDAALKESNAVVLSRLYGFLSVNQNQQAEVALPVVLDILEARLKRFEEQWVVPCLADGEAAAWLGGRYGAINDQAVKKRILQAVARLLADSVHVYAKQTLTPSEKRSLETAILATETQLRAMVNSNDAPSVSTIMIKNAKEPNKHDDMLAELVKWIGSADSEGLLNAAPFSFPVELGIERAPLPSAKAAETTPE